MARTWMLLKRNGDLGIRTDSFGMYPVRFVTSHAAEGLDGASLRAMRCKRIPVALNKALYGDSAGTDFSKSGWQRRFCRRPTQSQRKQGQSGFRSERRGCIWTVGRLSSIGYNICVRYEVVKSDGFLRWLTRLRDKRAQAQIVVRIDRVEEGHFGDHRSVGGGVSELRVNVGQGYRIYYTIRRQRVVILLCGGDKTSQQRDIRRAQQMASDLR